MNWSRLAIAAVAAWVASLIAGYVVNQVLLVDLFAANQAAYRPNAEIMDNLPLGFAAMLVGFFVFAYVYAKGYEGGNGAVEGARFGLLVGVMLVCFAIVWNYATTPISGTLGAAFVVDYLIEYTIYGAIVGFLYKPAAAAT